MGGRHSWSRTLPSMGYAVPWDNTHVWSYEGLESPYLEGGAYTDTENPSLLWNAKVGRRHYWTSSWASWIQSTSSQTVTFISISMLSYQPRLDFPSSSPNTVYHCRYVRVLMFLLSPSPTAILRRVIIWESWRIFHNSWLSLPPRAQTILSACTPRTLDTSSYVHICKTLIERSP
jgi:hypothetical protein